MTDPILCQIRDKEPPYAYCVDAKGHRSQTLRISDDPINKITSFQCMTRPKDHKFKIDREGNVVNE